MKKGLTADEIVKRAAEKNGRDIAARELFYARLRGSLWMVVGTVMWVGILAYLVDLIGKAL